MPTPRYTYYPQRPAFERHEEPLGPPGPKSKWFDPRMTWGNWITLTAIIVGGAVTWGEMRATAQLAARRLDTMEAKEAEIRKSYEVLSEKLGELRGAAARIEERDTAKSRQLDRIERTLEMLNGRRAPVP